MAEEWPMGKKLTSVAWEDEAILIGRSFWETRKYPARKLFVSKGLLSFPYPFSW